MSKKKEKENDDKINVDEKENSPSLSEIPPSEKKEDEFFEPERRGRNRVDDVGNDFKFRDNGDFSDLEFFEALEANNHWNFGGSQNLPIWKKDSVNRRIHKKESTSQNIENEQWGITITPRNGYYFSSLIPSVMRRNVLLKEKVSEQKLNAKNIDELEVDIANYGVLVSNFAKELDEKVGRYKEHCEKLKKEFAQITQNNLKYIRKKTETFRALEKKKAEDDFIIKYHTEFTPLLTSCYDVFELIFSYIDAKTLFKTVIKTCVFFHNVCSKKVRVQLIVDGKVFQKFPLEDSLSGAKIEQIFIKTSRLLMKSPFKSSGYGNPYPSSSTLSKPFVLDTEVVKSRFFRIAFSNKFNLKKLKITSLMFFISPKNYSTTENFVEVDDYDAPYGGYRVDEQRTEIELVVKDKKGKFVEFRKPERLEVEMIEMLCNFPNLEYLQTKLFCFPLSKIKKFARSCKKLRHLRFCGFDVRTPVDMFSIKTDLINSRELIKVIGPQLKSFKFKGFKKLHRKEIIPDCIISLERFYDAIFSSVDAKVLCLPIFPSLYRFKGVYCDQLMNSSKLKELSLSIMSARKYFRSPHMTSADKKNISENKRGNWKSFESFLDLLVLTKKSKTLKTRFCFPKGKEILLDFLLRITQIENCYLKIEQRAVFVDYQKRVKKNGEQRDGRRNAPWGISLEDENFVKLEEKQLGHRNFNSWGNAEPLDLFSNLSDRLKVKRIEFCSDQRFATMQNFLMRTNLSEICLSHVKQEQLLIVLDKLFSTVLFAPHLRKLEILIRKVISFLPPEKKAKKKTPMAMILQRTQTLKRVIQPTNNVITTLFILHLSRLVKSTNKMKSFVVRMMKTKHFDLHKANVHRTGYKNKLVKNLGVQRIFGISPMDDYYERQVKSFAKKETVVNLLNELKGVGWEEILIDVPNSEQSKGFEGVSHDWFNKKVKEVLKQNRKDKT